MLISEIKPIDKWGTDLLKSDDEDINYVIKQFVELPLRESCKIFREKGIKTLMSSANKNNIVKQGEKAIEKEDILKKSKENIEMAPTYEEAGKGYAWIMLDFESLSDENKDWLFSLEEKKSKNNDNIGERAIWFVHPCEINNLEYKKKMENDKRLAEFEKRHIVLAYHWGLYPLSTVFLRKPINENTTVEEVEEYFLKLAESFKTQEIEKKKVDLFERDII